MSAELTPREVQVLALLRGGMCSQEIATALGVGLRVVKFHISNLLAKKGMTQRAQLIAQSCPEGCPFRTDTHKAQA